MIYPQNFEAKIGFDEVRRLLKEKCLGILGKEKVDAISFTSDSALLNRLHSQTREMTSLLSEEESVPLPHSADLREATMRLRLEGTYMEEEELSSLRRSLDVARGLMVIVSKEEYPALREAAGDVIVLPNIIERIDKVVDKYGHLKDNASPQLQAIRSELARTEGSISRTLNSILRMAQSEGLVDKDASPTMRDGRLVIPVAPGLKRKIGGIVHDESASGKTVFIEPTEVVEANNRIRELEAEERREIIRILKEVAAEIRPHIQAIMKSFDFLGTMDLIRAKTLLAEAIGGQAPEVEDGAVVDWAMARHPLLFLSLSRQGKSVVPLDIELSPEKRMLIISGPNAGGKSVCLKTVGLLQYMVQMGLPVSMNANSRVGVFTNLMIDIGDEQSIEDDLSTYSSHLRNMKNMLRRADAETLLLIDEMGGGTEPTIGGAIAEAVLSQLCGRGAYGVITTHYRNLKEFADHHEGVVNGAMLYDRQALRPLFMLSMGQPGSSFAIEIARKTGLPEEVIRYASDLVGQDYIQSDKYIQDIIRDKRYWEGKRQAIHQHEKALEESRARLESSIAELEKSRKAILAKAKEEAAQLLREANRRIENAIREIREAEAERERTREIRDDLTQFAREAEEIEERAKDEIIEKKMRQIEERRRRKEKRRREKAQENVGADHVSARPLPQENVGADRVSARPTADSSLPSGSLVRIKGLSQMGIIEKTDGKTATIIFGDVRTRMTIDRLEPVDPTASVGATHCGRPRPGGAHPAAEPARMSHMTREVIDERRSHFHQDLDIRGLRGDEALQSVMHFIDDAIVVGMARVRILHGTGGGILRQLVRDYLSGVPAVSAFRDEHVQFGGAGITVVDL